MNKSAKIGLAIGGAAVVSGILYYVLKVMPNQNSNNSYTPGGGASASGSGGNNTQNILDSGQDALTTLTTGAQQVKQAVQTYLPPTTTSSNISPYEGKVVRFNGTQNVYLIRNGQKLWVQDPATLTALGFTFANVVNITTISPDSVPNGTTLTTANAGTYKAQLAVAAMSFFGLGNAGNTMNLVGLR